MGTEIHIVQENNTEFPNKIIGADFDLAEVKRMTSLSFLNECQLPIYQWRIMEIILNFSSWQSPYFPFNHNQNIGKLSLIYTNGCEWNLTVTLEDYGQKMDTNSSSCYFVVKYKYNVDDNSSDDGDFCRQINVFGGGKTKVSLFWNYLCKGVLRSILIEVFRVPAAIPHFSPSPNNENNNNMIVGKMEKFHEKIKLVNVVRILKRQPCFIFGSAEQRMTVSFMTGGQKNQVDYLGVTATLHIVNEREHSVPFVVTFTIFSEQKNKMDDVVNKIIIRPEEKEFDQAMNLAFFSELDNLMVNGTLYYKVVLEPLKGN